MADELRYETLFVTDAGAPTALNAAAEFRNDSAERMHIRNLYLEPTIAAASGTQQSTLEISKAPVLQTNVNNGVFFSRHVTVAGSGGVTGDHATREKWAFAKGQLTLEPNESLFMNIVKEANLLITHRATIDYHY